MKNTTKKTTTDQRANEKSFRSLTDKERARHMEIADIYANAVSERLEWLLRPIYEEIKAINNSML